MLRQLMVLLGPAECAGGPSGKRAPGGFVSVSATFRVLWARWPGYHESLNA